MGQQLIYFCYYYSIAFHYNSYGLELPESLPPGTPLPPFYGISDIDSGDNGRIVHFRIRGAESDVAYFVINDTTGVIALAKSLDYETKPRLDFELLAADGGDEPQWGRTKVAIQVSNINEYSPKFIGLPYTYYVQESVSSAQIIMALFFVFSISVPLLLITNYLTMVTFVCTHRRPSRAPV